MSAHRDPDMVAEYAKNARMRGLRVIIAGAGLAAALPGVVAAHTDLPVIGVPLTSKTSVAGGLDALLAIAQMPPGVPVATVGVDNPRTRPCSRPASSRRDRALHAPGDGGGLVGAAQVRRMAPGRAGGGRRAGRAGSGAGRGCGGHPRPGELHRRGGQGARAGHRPRRGGVRRRGGGLGRRGGPLGAPRAHLVRRARHRARPPALPGRDDPRGRRGRLPERADATRARARGHPLRGPDPRSPRGAHDVRREARRPRVRGAPQPAPARARGRGRVGGSALGRGGHLRRERARRSRRRC